jgi:hypothetical protein
MAVLIQVRRLLAALLLTAVTVAAASPSREDKVKAGFLFNFTQFVDWPADAFPGPASPMAIGVLGVDPFGDFLDELVRGVSVAGRPLVVRRCAIPSQAAACQLVFIRMNGEAGMKAALAALQGHPVLTVGDDPFFLRDGGMIRLAQEEGRLRLQIDERAARAARLVLSSKLLRRAELVPPGGVP